MGKSNDTRPLDKPNINWWLHTTGGLNNLFKKPLQTKSDKIVCLFFLSIAFQAGNLTLNFRLSGGTAKQFTRVE